MGGRKPLKTFIIQNICLRCGFSNETELALTNEKDNANYRCDNCKFIIFTSWMEENVEKN